MAYTKFEFNGFTIAHWDKQDGEFEFSIDQQKAGDCFVNFYKKDIEKLIKFLQREMEKQYN